MMANSSHRWSNVGFFCSAGFNTNCQIAQDLAHEWNHNLPKVVEVDLNEKLEWFPNCR